MALCSASPKFRVSTLVFHRMPVCRRSVTLVASSQRPSSRGHRSKSLRATKSGKNNAELHKELKEFLLEVGLPPDHVPSTKELSKHGRQDLANLVRRRGYKLIGELLRNSTDIDSLSEIDISAVDTFSNGYIGRGQDEGSSPAESVFFSSKIHQLCSSNGIQPILLDDSCKQGPSPSVSLNEKAARFILTGDLESLGATGTENCVDKALSMRHDLEVVVDSSGDDNQQPEGLGESSPGEEGSTSGHSAHLYDQTSFPASQPSRFNNQEPEELGESSPGEEGPTSIHSAHLYEETSFPASQPYRLEDLADTDFSDSSSVEQMSLKVSGTDSQLQIDKLKVMLHHKEIELLELKQQIENEKTALSNLQTKARKEIDSARRILSEKAFLLSSVEENLSGLKEVHIAYHGDGSTVEVAGSFNGWLHPIRMEPSTISGTIGSSGSRSPALWSTTLWLYPGVYEVKFIIDGIWKVDPQQERVVHGNIENNVIRVDI